MQHQTMFEAPASLEANYSNPYSNPELENEWETSHEMPYSNPYSNPELEEEWEHEAHYSNSYSNLELEDEWETSHEANYSNPYSNPELENEWEASPYSNSYSNPELENEWEASPYSNSYSSSEFEDEGEFFFKKFFRGLGRGLKSVAKTIGPKLAGTLVGMVPGVGAIAGPIASKLTGALLKEGEMEAMQMEAEFFGTNEAESEVSNTETAHEAALTEFLAAQAAESSNESESESAIAATLPITIRIMGGQRALRRVTPVMTQATAKMTQTLRQQGPAGKQLLRTVPTIQRQAVATLKAAARAGQPINSATAIKALASATNRVLQNPRRVQGALVRNAVLRQRTAPPNPRRMAANGAAHEAANGVVRCPKCASKVAVR